MLEKPFPELVDELVKEALLPRVLPKIEPRACPDQYVGIVGDLNNEQNRAAKDFLDRKPAEDRPNEKKCFILILESPHIDEFKGDPCPAKGRTGTQIRSYIHEVVADFDDYPKYGLILVNAIQYQCSLGLKPKFHRDVIFRYVWEKGGGRKDFIKRLENHRYLQQNDVIANCCTKGNDTDKEHPALRVLVQDAIEEVLKEKFPQVKLLRRNHPVNWSIKARRSYKWLI